MQHRLLGPGGQDRLRFALGFVERVYRAGVLPVLELRGEGVPVPATAAEGRVTDQGIVSLGIHHGDIRDLAPPRAEVHVSVSGFEPDEAWILGLPPRIPGVGLMGSAANIEVGNVPWAVTIDGIPMGNVCARRHSDSWMVRIPYEHFLVTVAGNGWEPSNWLLELHRVVDVSPYLANYATLLGLSS